VRTELELHRRGRVAGAVLGASIGGLIHRFLDELRSLRYEPVRPTQICAAPGIAVVGGMLLGLVVEIAGD